MATGVRAEIETEHPDHLIQQGLQQSVLHRVAMPQPRWENPLPEHTPGFLQMAFSFVFRSGDADPYQQRPRDIKQPKSSWEERWLEGIAKTSKAQKCHALQFWLLGRAQRIASQKQVVIAIKNTGIDRDSLPTKEDLIHNPNKRQELASKALSMKAVAKDTPPYWFSERQNVIGAFRYLADPPSYRDQIPMELSLFTTRAVSYNHHLAIHSLYPDAEEMKAKSTDHYSKSRLANVLKIPLYVQWVGSFIAELAATIAAPILQGTSIQWYRH